MYFVSLLNSSMAALFDILYVLRSYALIIFKYPLLRLKANRVGSKTVSTGIRYVTFKPRLRELLLLFISNEI